MSGSDGGSWIETPNGSSCADFAQQTTLSSPTPALAAVRNDEVLELHVSIEAGVVTALHQGQPVGSITAAIRARIVECAEQGYAYVAVVLSIQGAVCRVLVQPQ